MKGFKANMKFICFGKKLGYKLNKHSLIYLVYNTRNINNKYLFIFPLQNFYKPYKPEDYFLNTTNVNFKFDGKILKDREKFSAYEEVEDGEILARHGRKKLYYITAGMETYYGFMYKISPEEYLELGLSSL